MPWTISTEGLPLKKEIWSGNCFEGESGAVHISLPPVVPSWVSGVPSLSPPDGLISAPSSFSARKEQDKVQPIQVRQI